MIIGTRCNYMLPNHMQCANSALRDNDVCLLHMQIRENERLIAEETTPQAPLGAEENKN